MSSWEALDRELDGWAAAGRVATFWWRDDDAVAPTGQLNRLLATLDHAANQGAPICLAVIPAQVRPELASALMGRETVRVLQHGYAHLNHAPAGQKKAELGTDRPAGDVLTELRIGREHLAGMFGPAALPVLVPPWNRIAPAIAAALPAIGLRYLSTYGPRPPARQGAEIRRLNTHIDIMDWHAGRRFVGEAMALQLAVGHLAVRRRGDNDPDEPTGLLTHHLVHDEAAWRFVGAFLNRTLVHRAARWLNGAEIFPDLR
ncbi:MAG: polysaccharide deacetylase family protein [Dongiaceae bacterium]